MTTHDRRRQRRMLYLVGLLPSLLLLLLSARIVFLLHHEARGLDAYQASSFDEAREHFADNRFLNPVQRWVAPFNEGDARYRLEDFDGAAKAFEAALEVVPQDHECIVRVNLALSYEALGDSARDDGEGQVADEAYQDGRSALGPCLELLGVPEADEELDPESDEQLDEEEDPGTDEELDDEADPGAEPASDAELDTSQEVERVREAAVRVDARLTRKLGGPAPDLVPPPADAPPEDDRTRAMEREVEKRNEQAQEDKVEHQDEFDEDAEEPPPPSPVPQW